MRINLQRVEKLIELDVRYLMNAILGNTKIAKDMKVQYSSNSLVLYIYDYIKYIESGRRPKTKRVPISVLISWAKSKNISLTNSELYAIQNSIYNKGIRPKPNLLARIEQEYNKSFNKYYNSVLEPDIELQVETIITNSLKKYDKYK